MIRAGLRERTCQHSTEGRTGEKATTTEKACMYDTRVLGAWRLFLKFLFQNNYKFRT